MGQVSSVGGMDEESHHKSDDNTCIPQDSLSGEEGMSEEERNRRRAERRKAKRKRQKERRRQEREERREDADQEEDEGPDLLGSDSDEDDEEEERIVLPPSDKQAPPLATMGNRSSKSHSVVRSPAEEPEWDVSSAFVANAASHIRPRGRSGAEHVSRHNKENEARTSQQVETTDPAKQKGASLTEQGIELFKQRKYSQAMSMFTAAINCDPSDHRFFGNRSYCYWFLELYPLALADAQKSIQLAPDWPKGHFRRGSALMGLMRCEEAEKAMLEVLRLDKKCIEASSKLFNCRVLQLMDLGFEEDHSVMLLEKFSTVQAALASPEATRVCAHPSPPDYSGSPCPSLWVGNITVDLTETHIRNLFKTYGDIESIRVLHERFCAFVNFRNANMAAKALDKLQGVELENTRLVIRYPDRWMQRTNPGLITAATHIPPPSTGPRRLAPVNGDQCFFWRTTGCIHGDKCRYKHIPDQRGRDKKP